MEQSLLNSERNGWKIRIFYFIFFFTFPFQNISCIEETGVQALCFYLNLYIFRALSTEAGSAARPLQPGYKGPDPGAGRPAGVSEGSAAEALLQPRTDQRFHQQPAVFLRTLCTELKITLHSLSKSL